MAYVSPIWSYRLSSKVSLAWWYYDEVRASKLSRYEEPRPSHDVYQLLINTSVYTTSSPAHHLHITTLGFFALSEPGMLSKASPDQAKRLLAYRLGSSKAGTSIPTALYCAFLIALLYKISFLRHSLWPPNQRAVHVTGQESTNEEHKSSLALLTMNAAGYISWQLSSRGMAIKSALRSQYLEYTQYTEGHPRGQVCFIFHDYTERPYYEDPTDEIQDTLPILRSLRKYVVGNKLCVRK